MTRFHFGTFALQHTIKENSSHHSPLEKASYFSPKKLNVPKEGVERGQPLRHNPDPKKKKRSVSMCQVALYDKVMKSPVYADLKRDTPVVSGWWVQQGICSLFF